MVQDEHPISAEFGVAQREILDIWPTDGIWQLVGDKPNKELFCATADMAQYVYLRPKTDESGDPETQFCVEFEMLQKDKFDHVIPGMIVAYTILTDEVGYPFLAAPVLGFKGDPDFGVQAFAYWEEGSFTLQFRDRPTFEMKQVYSIEEIHEMARKGFLFQVESN